MTRHPEEEETNMCSPHKPCIDEKVIKRHTHLWPDTSWNLVKGQKHRSVRSNSVSFYSHEPSPKNITVGF
jgi:hypothetical protein